MDPFLEDFRDEKLYCISTGRVMPQAIADEIIMADKRGQEWFKSSKMAALQTQTDLKSPFLEGR